MPQPPKKSVPENLADTKDQVRYLALEVLTAKKANNPQKAVSGPEVFKLSHEQFEHDVKENTFNQYLSLLAKDKTSQINCPGRKQGYHLISESALPSSETEPAEKEKDKERQEREKHLYPVFKQWLVSQGYRQTKETAAMRDRDLGKFGNPDVTGLRRHKEFQKTTVLEFATIEVKISSDNWKSDIFEAVAHRRMGNRCYFAFAHPQDTINKLDPDIQHYGELYGIGILVLPIEEDEYMTLTTRKTKIDLSAYTALDVIVHQSAPFTPTNYHFRDRFLEALGVRTDDDLYSWGTAPD